MSPQFSLRTSHLKRGLWSLCPFHTRFPPDRDFKIVKKWIRGKKRGNSGDRDRETAGSNIISVSAALSCREQMYANTQGPPLRRGGPMVSVSGGGSHAPSCRTLHALTPASAAPPRPPPGLKAAWDAGPSPCPFDANPPALSHPGTLPGPAERGGAAVGRL